MTETAILSAVADVREAIERGAYALAIKRVRQPTGVGLREAKDVVDDIRRRAPAYRAGLAG